MDALTTLSFLCAVGSAITGLIGGIKARGLVPDSASNIRELVEILEAHLFATKRHLSPTFDKVKEVGGLEGKWDAATYGALQQAAESATALHNRITKWKALDTANQSELAGNARFWMSIGASLAAVSAALQLVPSIIKACSA